MSKKPSPYEDKRKHKRLPFNMSVAVERPGGVTFESTLNVSEGGVLLKTTEDYKIGEKLLIHMEMAGSEFVKAKAEVLRSVTVKGEHHIGLKFVDAPESLLEVIRAMASSKK